MTTARLRPLLFVALIALAPLAALFADAELLGLAVLESVGEDDSGLAVLNGLHSSVETDDGDIPYVHDIVIYTRWRAFGDHTIGVQIVSDGDGEIIADAEVDLSQDPEGVQYLTHDLANTVFPAAGVYRIEVLLDGESLGEYPFYLNASDQYPEAPVLTVSTPATATDYTEEMLPVISGAFESFTFKRIPAADDFIIATAWFSGDGDFEHMLTILDPKGNVVMETEPQSFSAYPGGTIVLQDDFNNFLFKMEGFYEVVVSLDGEEVLRYPLVVQKKT